MQGSKTKLQAVDQSARRAHMLNDPMNKLIPSVALPSIISMLVGAIYNMADTLFVGQLGNSATGAVGIVFPIMSLLQALGFVFAHGATSFISRLLGKDDTEYASRVVSTALFSAIVLGLLYGAVGLLFFDDFLRLFGSTETILPYARSYAVSIYVAAPVFAGSYVLNNCLRAEGSAVKSLIGMSSGAVLNVILDPIFIFALDMGVFGAGLATAIGQVVSFCLLLRFYLTGASALKLSVRLITLKWSMYYELVRVGIASFFRQGLSSLASILLNNAARPFGDGVIAAFSIVNRLMWMVNAVVVGYGQGYQPISGYNYGAGKNHRVYTALRFTLATTLLFTACCGMVFFAFAPWFVGLFRDDPYVIRVGAQILRYQSLTLPLMATVMVTTMLFQSIGKAIPSTLVAMARQGLCFIPAVLILPSVWGLTGLTLTQPVADALAFFVCLPLLIPAALRLRRDWKASREEQIT